MTPRKYTWIGAVLIAAAALTLWGCSALPVTQGTLDDVKADQDAAAAAAENGNVVRTVVSGLLALLGSVSVAVGSLKRHDAKPFQGTVNGRTVSATEDEIVAVVEKDRAGSATKG